MTSSDESAPRPRDRTGTESALVESAKALLSEAGFQALGINAIARRAGCDKQLIYRYFGGLDGLLDALGEEIARDVTRRLAQLNAPGKPQSYAELMERLALGLLQALRDDRLMQRVMAWEIAEPSPLLERLTLARSKAMVMWMMQTRGDLVPPPGVDAPACNAVLVAAVQHIVLASAASGQFSGLALRSDDDWERLRAALRRTIRALYAPV